MTDCHQCVKDSGKAKYKEGINQNVQNKRVLKPYCHSSGKIKICKMKLDMEEKKKRNIQNTWATSDNLNQCKVYLHQ